MLSFPNPSRSFAEARNAVRFTGYDGMVQVSFLVEAGALPGSGKRVLSEAECLEAFDAASGVIHDAARKAYSRRRDTLYTLTAADF